MIQRLVDGNWDDKEFLTVPPGWRVVAKYDEKIVTAEEIPRDYIPCGRIFELPCDGEIIAAPPFLVQRLDVIFSTRHH